jgi:hypothetical protein
MLGSLAFRLSIELKFVQNIISIFMDKLAKSRKTSNKLCELKTPKKETCKQKGAGNKNKAVASV